jgi:hypothetical protein
MKLILIPFVGTVYSRSALMYLAKKAHTSSVSKISHNILRKET